MKDVIEITLYPIWPHITL